MPAIPPRARENLRVESSTMNISASATKISGQGGNGQYSRDNAGFTPDNLAEAVEGSLRRLGVETIDLYQDVSYYDPSRIDNTWKIK